VPDAGGERVGRWDDVFRRAAQLFLRRNHDYSKGIFSPYTTSVGLVSSLGFYLSCNDTRWVHAFLCLVR
jgi:hypothetical protein